MRFSAISLMCSRPSVPGKTSTTYRAKLWAISGGEERAVEVLDLIVKSAGVLHAAPWGRRVCAQAALGSLRYWDCNSLTGSDRLQRKPDGIHQGQ